MKRNSKLRTRRNKNKSKPGKYEKVRKTKHRTRKNRQRGGGRFKELGERVRKSWSNLGKKTRRFARSARSRVDSKYRAKLETEKAEADRLVAEKASADRLATEADRLAVEKTEADRLATEKASADEEATKRKEREEKEAKERRDREEEYKKKRLATQKEAIRLADEEDKIRRKKWEEKQNQEWATRINERNRLIRELELLINIAEKEGVKVEDTLEYWNDYLKEAKLDLSEIMKRLRIEDREYGIANKELNRDIHGLHSEIADHIIAKIEAKNAEEIIQKPFIDMMDDSLLTSIGKELSQKLKYVNRCLNVTIKDMHEALSDPNLKFSLIKEFGQQFEQEMVKRGMELRKENVFTLFEELVLEKCVNIMEYWIQQKKCEINGGYLPIQSKVVIIRRGDLFGESGTIIGQMKDKKSYNIELDNQDGSSGPPSHFLIPKDKVVLSSSVECEKLIGKRIWKNIGGFPFLLQIFEKINKYCMESEKSEKKGQMKQKMQNMAKGIIKRKRRDELQVPEIETQ